MPFSDIVGHKKQLETLRRGLERDRLHHAYLFTGPEGVGKRAVALALAAAIHCPFKEDDSCGRCGVCVSIRDGNHPDIRVLEPEAKKREIVIDQIRDLQRQLAYRSFSGTKKIVIIDPAHLMNYHAQNSLLKTLEDPPGDSLLILIAKSAGSLLPTVLSRCLRMGFNYVPVMQVAEILVQRRGIPEDRAKVLAALTGGSLGEALTSDVTVLIDQRMEWIERFSSLAQGDYRGVMALAEEVASDREKSLQVFQWAEGWYRDILIHRITGSEDEIRNIDMAERVHDASSGQHLGHVLSLLSRIGKITREIQRNYNRRMVLEDFLIKVADRNPEWS